MKLNKRLVEKYGKTFIIVKDSEFQIAENKLQYVLELLAKENVDVEKVRKNIIGNN